MGICSRRHFLLTICSLQLVSEHANAYVRTYVRQSPFRFDRDVRLRNCLYTSMIAYIRVCARLFFYFHRSCRISFPFSFWTARLRLRCALVTLCEQTRTCVQRPLGEPSRYHVFLIVDSRIIMSFCRIDKTRLVSVNFSKKKKGKPLIAISSFDGCRFDNIGGIASNFFLCIVARSE